MCLFIQEATCYLVKVLVQFFKKSVHVTGLIKLKLTQHFHGVGKQKYMYVYVCACLYANYKEEEEDINKQVRRVQRRQLKEGEMFKRRAVQSKR